jgi:competence protein ComGC
MAVVFLTTTIVAVLENSAIRLDFWSLAGAAETASWRLKFVAVPVSICSLWVGTFLYRSISRGKGRFAGIGLARTGLALSLLVTVLFVTTIAITIPARLRQQEDGQKAGENAKLYALQYALLKYRSEHNTFAWELDNLTNNGIEDPDGSIARVVEELKKSGVSYTPRSDVAATLPKAKATKSKGAALRSVSAATSDDITGQRISMTSYEIRLPGPDNMLGTADDPRMVDGRIITPSTPEKVVDPNP